MFLLLDTYWCSGALDAESLRELYSKIGTVIDEPQEEDEYVDDEYVLMLPLTVASSCLTKTCRMMTTTTSMTTTLRPIFLVLLCSDMSRPISSYPGSFRYCFSRSKQLLDTVSNQAVSK